MKRLDQTNISELIQSFDIKDEDLVEIIIYSTCKYANCNDNIMIASFINSSLDRIGSWLLSQKINAYKIRSYGKLQEISIYCEDI